MKLFVLPPGSRHADVIHLSGKDYHYLVNVRRVSVGDCLDAIDGNTLLSLSVAEIRNTVLVLQISSSKEPQSPTFSITLFPFLLKARKLDDVIRQACEAGVQSIYPVEGDHCVAKVSEADSKLTRWNTIAREAAQQSGHSNLAQVHTPIRSRSIPETWNNQGPLLLFHETPLDTGTLHRYLFSRPEQVGIIVGPEGGISPAEVALFRASGALPVWFGPFVLRAETASLYAAAAVNMIFQESQEWTIR